MKFLSRIFRCDCPVTSAIDIVGDKWTLVIIKQMLLEHKKTFKQFSESEEAIAPNILSDRLKKLVKTKLIDKVKYADNKKTNIYSLTEKGLSLTPVIIELALWSHENIKPVNKNIYDLLNTQIKDKYKLHQMIINSYKAKTTAL